jgi:8-oxo-dGTP pyrophosphatase MutT (NUDIX family)
VAHINDLIDFTVAVFIVYNNKVLLVMHKKQQKWLPIGGHIELHEDPDEALAHEIAEECGLEVEMLTSKPEIPGDHRKSLFTPNYMDIHKINNVDHEHKHVGLIYFARAKSSEVKLALEEHDDIRWFGEADLENPEFAIQEDIKFYAKEALNKAKI